jgi:hypothetical protein
MKRIIDNTRQPAMNIRKRISTIRVISPGLLSKFNLANRMFPRYINTSSWAKNKKNRLKLNEERSGYFPVSVTIKVPEKENIRNVRCESGLRRSIKSLRENAFISSNLIFLY